MSHKIFYSGVALLGLSGMSCNALASKRPNIIYINADDLGIMDVGYNSSRYNTPNIDKLKAEGMVFTNNYAAAANSAPSRASVFTGQYTPRHGVYTVGTSERGNTENRKLIPIANTDFINNDNLTFTEILNAGGYKTIHLGKWHITKDPLEKGFDINIGGGAAGSPYGGYFAPFKGPMEKYNVYGEGTHSGDIFADQAIRFLRDLDDEQPFFMHMAYYLVHTPLQKVPELFEKYKGTPGLNATYASMIEKMDQSIGAIMDELERQGQKENTFILFSSDNGGICATSSQHPYRAGKGSYFEGGIREPLIIRWPEKVLAGTMCEVPVIGLDYYPTFLEVAGLSAPKDKKLDGVSLMPLLKQKRKFPKRALFWHFPVYLQEYSGDKDDSHDPLFRTRPGSVILDGKWKLHEYFEDGRLELYDLENDPGERHNLVKEFPKKAKQMHAKLKKWRKKMNAPVPLELNPEFKAVI
jgi:arylsulfatase A-like enzyme